MKYLRFVLLCCPLYKKKHHIFSENSIYSNYFNCLQISYCLGSVLKDRFCQGLICTLKQFSLAAIIPSVHYTIHYIIYIIPPLHLSLETRRKQKGRNLYLKTNFGGYPLDLSNSDCRSLILTSRTMDFIPRLLYRKLVRKASFNGQYEQEGSLQQAQTVPMCMWACDFCF